MKISLDKSNRRSLVVSLRVYGPEEGRHWELVGAVDTGASTVVIPWEVAHGLGYRLDGAELERLVAGNGVIYAPRIALRRIDVEGASATGVEAICHDLPDECPVDALIGLSFLTRFGVTFDFNAWEMQLAPRPLPERQART